MKSCILYHGPAAQEAARREASKYGILYGREFGAEGLRVDEARELSGLILSPPYLREDRTVLIAGPMQEANDKAKDALLKALEEFNPDHVLPLLWASDEGSVSATIRSRCVTQWCPGEDPFADAAPEHLNTARQLLTLIIAGDMAGVCMLMRACKDVEGFTRALAHVLAWERPNAALWASLRPLLKYEHLHYTEVLSAVLEVMP